MVFRFCCLLWGSKTRFYAVITLVVIIAAISAFSQGVQLSAGWYFKTSYNPNSSPGSGLVIKDPNSGTTLGSAIDWVSGTGSAAIAECELQFLVSEIYLGAGTNVVSFGLLEFPMTHFGPSFAGYFLLGNENKTGSRGPGGNVGIGISYDQKVYDKRKDSLGHWEIYTRDNAFRKWLSWQFGSGHSFFNKYYFSHQKRIRQEIGRA